MRTTPYHKQLTPEYRKAKRTHKRLRLAKRLGETPEGLLAAGSAVRERFEFGWEPPEDCPKKCGGILVWRSHPDSWKPKPRQGYYFKQWRVCNGCSYVQHQERYKVFVTLKRADTLLAGVQGRLAGPVVPACTAPPNAPVLTREPGKREAEQAQRSPATD